MAKILETKSLYYNDVNIINNKPGQVVHRQDVPRELWRIIVSPMDAVVGKTFAIEAAKLGLTVVLHRFCTKEQQKDIYLSIPGQYRKNVYCSIGLEENWDRMIHLYQGINNCPNICLDIALGMHPNIPEKLKELNNRFLVEKLIIGNVHSKEGVNFIRQWTTDYFPDIIIRTGIGNGIGCSSSDMVGVNRGMITEIIECFEESDKDLNRYLRICADGGLRKPSYFCKAFAAGADFCMAGGYWMQTKEAESNLIGDGSYWGGASHKQQVKTYGRKRIHSEGKEIEKLYDKKQLRPLSEVVEELWLSIASFVSYSGFRTLTEAIGEGTFEIKQNSLPPKERY